MYGREVVLNMMRCGNNLGPIAFETDKISLMRSAKPEDDKEFLKNIRNGNFIVKKQSN